MGLLSSAALAAADAEAEPAAGPGVAAAAGAVVGGLEVGTVDAMASICDLSALAPAALGSLELTNSVIVSSKFLRASTMASSPCNSGSLASICCLFFETPVSSCLPLAISFWIDCRWPSNWSCCCVSACGAAFEGALGAALASLLINSALARAMSNARPTTLSAVWRLANRISRSLGWVAFCCWVPSVRYQSTVSSRIWTT